MLKQQLLYCVRNEIPLPEVFLYVSKTNNETIESNDPLKQMALKSYLSVYAQNFISFNENNSENCNKQLIFKGMIKIIFQNRSILGKRLNHFIIIYDKLVKLFEEWGDNEAILDLYNIKHEYDIEFPKRKYFKKLMIGKKNTILQILKNSIQKDECIIETLYGLQVQGDRFILIHDERLLSSLKLKPPCQIFKNNVTLYEQDIIMGMLRLICKYKEMFSHQLASIDAEQLFTIQNKEAEILLQEIFQKDRQRELQNIEQRKIKDYSSKPMEAILRQNVIKKQFRIYIQYILDNKIPLPEIILVLQIPTKSTQNMTLNASKEFLYEMSKLKCFEEFNKNLYISESIIQWKHSLSDLQWLEQHLSEKFPISNQIGQLKLLPPEKIIENLEITYNSRYDLVERLINIYNHARAKWFLEQYSQRPPFLNQQCKRIGNLLLSLQDFVIRKTQPIDRKDLSERIEDLKRITNKKLFTKPISAPRSSKIVDENVRKVFRLLVKYGQPVPEFLRFYKLRSVDKVKTCRMKLNITQGLIQYLESEQEIQRFLVRYFTDNKIDVKYDYQIKMSDFKQNEINLDERHKQQPEQEVMINMLVLIEKYKDNYRDFLIEMFKEPSFELFYLELTDVTSYQQQKTTQLNQALNIIRRIDDNINQDNQLTIDV